MHDLSEKKFYFAFEGMLFGLYGIAALILAGIFPAAAQCLFGLAFLLGGITMGLRILVSMNVAGVFFSTIASIAFIVGGIIGLTVTFATAAGVMWYVAIFLWIFAGAQFMTSMCRIKTSNWGFLFIGSVIFAVIAVVIVLQSVLASSWTLSILFGIVFLIYAGCMILTAITCQK